MTNGQTTFDFTAAEKADIEASRPRTKREAFEAFDKANPDVWREIVATCRRLKAEGRKRWGIAAIWENLRWSKQDRTTGDPYKMNNNHKTFYVAKLAEHHPDLAAMFERRKRDT